MSRQEHARSEREPYVSPSVRSFTTQRPSGLTTRAHVKKHTEVYCQYNMHVSRHTILEKRRHEHDVQQKLFGSGIFKNIRYVVVISFHGWNELAAVLVLAPEAEP